MPSVMNEAWFSSHEGNDVLPFRSDDPFYSDTWGVATVDPDSNQAFWAQVLHNGSSGRARHLLMVISDGKSSCDYAYTEPGDCFHSDLMDVELAGWTRYRVTSKRLRLSLESVSGHQPIDFAKTLTFKDFSLGHQEAGVRTTGQINGKPFDGAGLRDRSFGRRPMSGTGLVNSVVLVSTDLRASFAANMVHGSRTPLADASDSKFAFVSTPEGASATFDRDRIGIRRAADGVAVGLRIGDDILTIEREIGHHHYTPHWYPTLDLRPAEQRISQHILRFIEGHHPAYGRMAGLTDTGVLLAC